MQLFLIRIFAIASFLFVGTLPSAEGQTTKVRAGFVFDSLRVGDEIPFYLTATYSAKEQVVFPDSTHNFAPFEFRKKEWFPTETRDTVSYDSVVYYLSTFEIDRIQRLKLPVFQLTPKDCTLVLSNVDSVRLQQLVPSLPDSMREIPVRATIAYQKVPYETNYPLITIVLGLLLITMAVVYFVFGAQLKTMFRERRMKRAHIDFLATFEKYLRPDNTTSVREIEAALVLWKTYMEKLNAKPYTKLTTKETIGLEKDEQLGRSLQTIDAALYGHETSIHNSLRALRVFADRRYQMKVQEVKHG